MSDVKSLPAEPPLGYEPPTQGPEPTPFDMGNTTGVPETAWTRMQDWCEGNGGQVHPDSRHCFRGFFNAKATWFAVPALVFGSQ